MENKTFMSKASLSFLGLILIIPSLFSWGIWIKVVNANPDKTQADKVAIYLTHFPSFVQSLNQISLITTAFGMVGLVLSIISTIKSGNILLRRDRLIFKSIAVFSIIICAVMTLLNLFQLM